MTRLARRSGARTRAISNMCDVSEQLVPRPTPHRSRFGELRHGGPNTVPGHRERGGKAERAPNEEPYCNDPDTWHEGLLPVADDEPNRRDPGPKVVVVRNTESSACSRRFSMRPLTWCSWSPGNALIRNHESGSEFVILCTRMGRSRLHLLTILKRARRPGHSAPLYDRARMKTRFRDRPVAERRVDVSHRPAPRMNYD